MASADDAAQAMVVYCYPIEANPYLAALDVQEHCLCPWQPSALALTQYTYNAALALNQCAYNAALALTEHLYNARHW